MTTATMTQLRAIYWAPTPDQTLTLAARDGWLPAAPGSPHAATCGPDDPGAERMREALSGAYVRPLAATEWTAEHLDQARAIRSATLDQRSGAAVSYQATCDRPAPVIAHLGIHVLAGPVVSAAPVAVDPDEQRAEALRLGRQLLATVTAGDLCDLLRARQVACWTAANEGRSEWRSCAAALTDALCVALAKCVDLERELRRAADEIVWGSPER